jgi:hypothetical protein
MKKYRFIANLFSILVAVTSVSTPSSERYGASRISQDQAWFVLSVNIRLHQVYPKLPD